MLAAALFAIASPGVAQTIPDETGALCVQDEGGNSCTANDVRITGFACKDCPESCEPGEPYTATLVATVESTPQKYDVGFYFTEDGTSAYSGDSCTRDILTPVTDNQAQCGFSSNTSGLGPFKDADDDLCGDTPTGCVGIETKPCSEGGGTCEVTRREIVLETLCVDANGDNIADIHSCTAWSQSEGDECNSPLDAVPGTPSKCHCAYVSTVEIVVEPDCVTDADCSDNNICDGVEICNDEGFCEEGDDALSCDNDTFCDGEEACDPLDGCLAGTPPECNDGLFCTTDSCDEGNNTCATAPVVCNDSVACTDDECNESTDQCDYTPDDGFCADGAFCNGNETCDAVAGCQAGTPPECGDGVSCTDDSCNEGTDECDNEPNDALCADGNVCNGDETCDPQAGCLPGDNLPPDTPCGDGTDTACTNPDTCDGDGVCLNNNEVCGAVTNSALCEFDVEPDKGVCRDGDEAGPACSLSAPVCPDGFTCEESNEFRLGFNTDGGNKKAYRPPYSNPGQFYYNAFYDGSLSGGDGDVIAIQVPWPFITQGATPLHVYDGNDVGTLDTCFMPGEALVAEQFLITLNDWRQPAGYVKPDHLDCDQVDGIGESGFCTLLVEIPQALIDAVPGSLLYINLHLDYGLKGNWTDGLPPFGAVDLYDYGLSVSPWGSRDALQDTNAGNGPVAIQDCTQYGFSHWDENGLLFEDSAQNLNSFNIPSKGKP